MSEFAPKLLERFSLESASRWGSARHGDASLRWDERMLNLEMRFSSATCAELNRAEADGRAWLVVTLRWPEDALVVRLRAPFSDPTQIDDLPHGRSAGLILTEQNLSRVLSALAAGRVVFLPAPVPDESPEPPAETPAEPPAPSEEPSSPGEDSMEAHFERLSQAATLARDDGDIELALSCAEQCLELDPHSLEMFSLAEELCLVLERWDVMLSLLERQIEATTDDETRKEVLFKAALISEEMLADVDRAIGFYLQVLELDPGDGVALDTLTRLLTQTERWSELENVMRMKIEVVYDPAERIALLFQLATLQNVLADPGKAAKCLQQVLEIDPSHLEALELLENLYMVHEDWEPLCDVLEKRAELSTDPAKVVDARMRQAILLTEMLDAPDRARKVLKQILLYDPDNDQARMMLDGLRD